MNDSEKQAPEPAFSRGATITIGLVCALICLGMAAMAPSASVPAAFYGLSGLCGAIAGACFSTGKVRRFFGRVIGAAVFVVTAWYFIGQLFDGHGVSGGSGKPSLFKAAIVAVIFGIPGLMYAVFGRLSWWPQARTADEPEIGFQQADTPELVDLARDLFLEYEKAIDTDLAYQGFAAELASLPGPYEPPRGALLIAHDLEEALGCVALKPLDDRTAEMKRLYVRPAARSRGVGQRLVEAAIEAARQAGYSELRLDTLPSMASAQALYRRLGFEEIPPYGNASLPGTRFFALKLDV